MLITGAGRGIGSGIAEVLAEAGATVALNALTPTYAEQSAIAERLQSGKVEVFAGDVTQTDGAEQLVARVPERFARIDVLINNLGDAIMEPLVALPETSTQTIDDARLQRILDLNMMATMRCTRAAAPQMLERRSGKLINISSYTVARGGARLVIYTAAKAAVVGFTQAQALEWARYNVQVNAIAPGSIPIRARKENKVRWRASNTPRGSSRADAPDGCARRAARALPGLGRLRLHDGPDALPGRRRLDPLKLGALRSVQRTLEPLTRARPRPRPRSGHGGCALPARIVVFIRFTLYGFQADTFQMMSRPSVPFGAVYSSMMLGA